MKKGLMAAGAGLIGIVLAVFLFQRPDTGGEVKAPERAAKKSIVYDVQPDDGEPILSARPPTADGEPRGTLERPGGADPFFQPASEAPTEYNGPNPFAAEAAAKRALPEAVQSGKASVPWTLIRRNLLRVDSPEGQELGAVANQLVLDLRSERRDPDAFDYVELETRQKDLLTKIRASSFMEDAEIARMGDRVDEVLAEYYQIKEEQE
jgi:hypothetical protein